MNLICEVKRADFFAFNLAFHRNSRMMKAIYLIFFALVTWDMSRISARLEDPPSLPIIVVVSVLMGLMFTLALIAVTVAILAFWVFAAPHRGKNRALLGQHEYELVERGLLEKTEITETLVKFIGLEKIVSTKRHVFIFYGTFQAAIIPKRRILSGDVVDFERALREKIA